MTAAPWDDESRELYLRGGYDVTCEMCNGLRVVEVVDETQLSPRHRAAYEAHLEAEAEVAREEAYERRYGY